MRRFRRDESRCRAHNALSAMIHFERTEYLPFTRLAVGIDDKSARETGRSPEPLVANLVTHGAGHPIVRQCRFLRLTDPCCNRKNSRLFPASSGFEARHRHMTGGAIIFNLRL